MAMLLAGKTVKQVADELGGISTQAIYHYFPGGLKGLSITDKPKE